MKKVLVASSVLAALLMSGCAVNGGKCNTCLQTESCKPKVAQVEESKPEVIEEVKKDEPKDTVDLGALLASLQDKMQSVYFDFDQYNVKADQDVRVSNNAEVVESEDAKALDGLSIRLEGNCDERGTDEYNYALGLKRANAAKEAMEARGVATDSMIVVSNGEANPVCEDTTDECYAQNRRVDFKLIK